MVYAADLYWGSENSLIYINKIKQLIKQRHKDNFGANLLNRNSASNMLKQHVM